MKVQKNQKGFVVTAELLFIATILVIGLIIGWVLIRNSVIAEMSDTAASIGALDQSYAFGGATIEFPPGSGTTHWVSGSTFTDALDGCDQGTAEYPCPAFIAATPEDVNP